MRRLTTPAITAAYAEHIWTTLPNNVSEHFRQIDYRSRLTSGGSTLSDADIAARLRELSVSAENAQNSAPRLPEYAGQFLQLPGQLLNTIHQVDPQLAARVAAEGVYVNLNGRADLRAYALDNVPDLDIGSGVPRFDLTTPEGRQALLMEDRARAEAALRTSPGTRDAAVALLATNSLHYANDGRTMYLVPDVLTSAIALLAPPPTLVSHEATATSVTAARTTATADRVTLPTPARHRSAPTYGRPVDSTGQHVPLFNGPPVREQVAQGELGDCGMLATLAAVVGHRPHLMNQLVRPNHDGTVDVVLHESSTPGGVTSATGRELRITVSPDVPAYGAAPADSAYASQRKAQAAWASAVEKAIAAVDRTWSNARRDLWQDSWREWTGQNSPNAGAPLGYGRLNVGSTPDLWAELLTQLTGEPARAVRFDRTPGTEPATEAWLGTLLAAGNPIIVSTMNESRYPAAIRTNLPFNLRAGHAYEVVGVGDGQVRLRNPWNTEHPASIPVRQFLDLMAADFAHLDSRPATAPAPAVTGQQAPPSGPHAAPGTVGVHHAAGRVRTDEHGYSHVYYAVMAVDGTVEGLTVVEVTAVGPRSARWMASQHALGLGGERVVTRPEAERIAIEALGFALPDETTLHGMLDG
ncbi:C2 family cysteine protease [Actinoplanes sp. NPDC049668]|uniref:C2 family cysteine protease n=1 Tax=unclassified Actinoplanes TaxID=2626549 RepID=UPI0033A4DD2D